MTSPPQPQRKTIVDDLDLGVSGNQIEAATGKRKAANDKQRKAAEDAAEYDRWRASMTEEIWGRE